MHIPDFASEIEARKCDAFSVLTFLHTKVNKSDRYVTSTSFGFIFQALRLFTSFTFYNCSQMQDILPTHIRCKWLYMS